jgi:hypothetical protein
MEDQTYYEERTYYTLMVQDDHGSPWEPLFGAYKRMDVMHEAKEWMAAKSIGAHPKTAKIRVLTTGDSQASIDGNIRMWNNLHFKGMATCITS